MKNHYICEDPDGNLFMTTEKCVSKEDAQQYVGENKVLYPFLQKNYEKNYQDKIYREFYEQIDWVKLGKFLEDERNFDGTGWENLGRAWRKDDRDGVLAYIYRAFNKSGNYSYLLDNMDVLPEEQRDIFQSLINKSYMYQKYEFHEKDEV